MAYYIPDLKAKTGYSARTVNNWIRRGVLPPVPFRGRLTAYGDVHLVRLLAIRQLRAEGLHVPAIQHFFKTASEAAVRKTAGLVDLTEATVQAKAAAVVRWTHVALADGVMLLIRDDASDAGARITAAIRAAFDAAAPSAAPTTAASPSPAPARA